MFLVLAAYLGGVLTILSPCILPVLPFVFARSDQTFTRRGRAHPHARPPPSIGVGGSSRGP